MGSSIILYNSRAIGAAAEDLPERFYLERPTIVLHARSGVEAISEAQDSSIVRRESKVPEAYTSQ